jgi:hypothetical protein
VGGWARRIGGSVLEPVPAELGDVALVEERDGGDEDALVGTAVAGDADLEEDANNW